MYKIWLKILTDNFRQARHLLLIDNFRRGTHNGVPYKSKLIREYFLAQIYYKSVKNLQSYDALVIDNVN